MLFAQLDHQVLRFGQHVFYTLVFTPNSNDVFTRLCSTLHVKKHVVMEPFSFFPTILHPKIEQSFIAIFLFQ
jgi:hypothetical protein